MKTQRILVTCKQMQVELPKYLGRIRAAGYDVVAPDLDGRQEFSAAELGRFSDAVVGVIAGDDELNAAFFDTFVDLRVLVRWGIGTDSVDFEAASRHEVTVRNTPGVFGREVADSAMGYVLNLARGFHEVDRAVRTGSWPKLEGLTLGAHTLGVVGFGVIGREIAKRARAFGMDVIVHDPFADDTKVSDVRFMALEDLLRLSKFVVLACPLTAETKHLLDDDKFAFMRRDAYLVNVARGPIVDEAALARALDSGEIAGAGLDVYEVEPLALDSPLRVASNVLLGAHNGSNTREGVEAASLRAVEILLGELDRSAE